MNEFLGKTNFTGYFNAETREKGVFEAKIWEDKINNYTYLLDVSMQKHGKECWLFIVDNKKEYFYTRAIAVASFSKWEDYIKFKKRFEKPENFTYQDYIKDQTAKGDELIGVLSE